jgi:threonine dehydrogenase-like Zn-dependent dehydrogenase
LKKEKDMKAICWHSKHDVRCDTVPEPKIEHPRDAIIEVTLTAILKKGCIKAVMKP